MKTILIIAFLAVVSAENIQPSISFSRKNKRGAGSIGSNGFNLGYNGPFNGPFNGPYNGFPMFNSALWNPMPLGGTSFWDPAITSDLALGQIQLQATHNLALQALHEPHVGTPSISHSPDVLRAIQFAKEANHHVQLAQHRVDEAKQAAIIQQRVALAKEAAAREAAHRSAEIAAHAETEARFSAKQLVALQQRLATLKDSVAAAQRLAAARENAAAAAIQRNAADTAAEIRKQDVDKQISQTEREARVRDLIATKENAISHALHNNALHRQVPLHQPWG